MKTKIIVDSSKIAFYSICKKTIFCAIEHFGFYYKIIDLTFKKFFSQEFEDTNLLILGQEGLGFSLGEAETSIILKNVYSGMGLVIFDGYIEKYPESFLKTLEIEKISTKKTSKIKLNLDSWICQGTILNEVELKNNVIFSSIKKGQKLWKPFLFSEKNDICGIYGYFGKGKVVIFLTSAGLWQDNILGHTRGLDDVFWRSLIWASKKPFITKTIPPFITARIDDVSASGSQVAKYKETVERIKYVEILNRFNIVPNLGLFINDIKKKDIEVIRKKYYEKVANFSPHAFSDPENTNEFPIYMKQKGEEFSEYEIRENFKKVDKKFFEFGIKPSLTLNVHFGTIGLNALPFLKERNQKFLMNIIKVGKSFNSPDAFEWNLLPYGKIEFSLSEIPEDMDFFNVLSMPFNIERKNFSNKIGDFDFLYGCTQFWNENSSMDIKKAIKRGVFQIKRGLENKFFGCLMTHEQRISFLKLQDWEEIIKGIMNEVGLKDNLFKSYDYISVYTKNLKSVFFEKIEIKEKLEITLKGNNEIILYFSIFYDVNDRTLSNCLEIPPFQNYTILTFKI